MEDTPYYIKEDFPIKILNIRKELQNELKRKRDEGIKAVLRYDKIITLENTNNNKRHNKRLLSQSPDNNTVKEDNAKQRQVQKKNKTTNIIPNFFTQSAKDYPVHSAIDSPITTPCND